LETNERVPNSRNTTEVFGPITNGAVLQFKQGCQFRLIEFAHTLFDNSDKTKSRNACSFSPAYSEICVTTFTSPSDLSENKALKSLVGRLGRVSDCLPVAAPFDIGQDSFQGGADFQIVFGALRGIATALENFWHRHLLARVMYAELVFGNDPAASSSLEYR
jgi:hypothetical protein